MSLFHLSGQHRSVLIAWLVATLGIPIGSALPAQASDVHVHHALFGMTDASLQSSHLVHEGSVRLWDVGVQWREVETSRGHYDWTRLDQLVRSAQAAHEDVTMVVAMTPSFYGSDPNQTFGNLGADPPSRISHYADFVSALMHRYKRFKGERGISSYEVWNESNIRTFWTGTQRGMAKLSQAVFQVRNRVDPRAKVISPPMVTLQPYQFDWMKKFYAVHINGKPVSTFYDALSFSLYPHAKPSGKTGTPEDSMRQLAHTRRVLRSEGVKASKPIWNTEVNYGLQIGALAGQSAYPISNARQASFVARTYLLNAAHGVKRVFWYRFDWATLPGGGQYSNTLLSRPDDPSVITPAGKAYVLVQKWMHGRLLGPKGHQPCEKDSHGTYHCVAKDSTGKRWIYWNPDHKASVKVSSHVRHLQTVLGAVSTLKGGSTITVNDKPVMVRH